MALNHPEAMHLFLVMGVLLLSSRTLGEFFRLLGQPMVVGELFAGILLGPTVLGFYFPEVFDFFFQKKNTMLALDGFTKVAVTLLLFTAGLEVDLAIIIKHRKASALISLFSIIIPFLVGFGSVYLLPQLYEHEEFSKNFVFAFFMGTALSITALPVLARILMDLNILKTALGLSILAAAMLDDFCGWLLFSILLSIFNNSINVTQIFSTIGFTLLYSFITLTMGRAFFNKILPYVNKKLSWPGGVLSLSIGFCLLAAWLAEFIGIHAVFGAFIVGTALGDSPHFNERAKEILFHFVNNIFAPVFFVSVGLKVNFAEHFDFNITLFVIFIATFGKIIGAFAGAKMMKFGTFQALIIASCMIARGAMEIILGLLALEAKIINEKIFVSLVIMAFFTSMVAGPMAKWFMKTNI